MDDVSDFAGSIVENNIACFGVSDGICTITTQELHTNDVVGRIRHTRVLCESCLSKRRITVKVGRFQNHVGSIDRPWLMWVGTEEEGEGMSLQVAASELISVGLSFQLDESVEHYT